MALEKIRPRVVDETGNYTFNNVTATGTLISANANLGNLATANYVSTDHLLYANGVPWSIGTGSVVGSNTQVQYNDGGGAFGASSTFTFNKGTNTLTVTNITANGAGLTSLTGANVTGFVPNATYATSAGTATTATNAGTVTTNAQPNITSVGSLSSLTVTGNLVSGNADLGNSTSSNYYLGNGYFLSSVSGGNVLGQVAYAGTANSVAGSNVVGAVTYASTANAVAGANVLGQVTNAAVAGTVYTNAQPNITSVGTLTSLSVTGNVSANYFLGNGSQLTGVSASTVTGANVSGNVGSANVAYYANITANSTSSSSFFPVFVSSTGNSLLYVDTTANDLSYQPSSGNLTAAQFVGNGYYLTGIVSSYGNSNVASYLSTYTGNVSANYFIGNGSTLTNITGANITGNAPFAGTANYANTANAVAGANVTGQVGNALIAGTVYTNAQPNITSTGTLTSLTVSGNANLTGANVFLGNVSNLHITGGSSTYVLSTDGAGNLSWVAPTTSAGGSGNANISGSNTQIFFNDANSNTLGSSANLTFDKGTKTLTTDRAVLVNGANLGSNISNVYIGGGASSQILSTDESGNLAWIAQPTAVITVDNFTGNGVQTTFTLSTTPTSINQTIINYNGAFQLRNAYTLSGANVVFSEAPANGSYIEVTTTIGATAGTGAFVTRTYTGNGVQNTFTVTSGATVSSVLVTENGLVQTPTTDYTISGSTLTFATAPANAVLVQVRELGITLATGSGSALTIKDEGSNLTTTATSIDFVGGGITATNTGNAVTVTVPTGTTRAQAMTMGIIFGG